MDISSEPPVPLEPRVTIVTPPKGGAEGQTNDVPPIPEYPLEEELRQNRMYRLVQVGGEEVTVNLSLIEPYRKIVQHAGEGTNYSLVRMIWKAIQVDDQLNNDKVAMLTEIQK